MAAYRKITDLWFLYLGDDAEGETGLDLLREAVRSLLDEGGTRSDEEYSFSTWKQWRRRPDWGAFGSTKKIPRMRCQLTRGNFPDSNP
jgi:hypothetical protein